MELGRYSLGIGDRFGHQARAQLQACLGAAQAGLDITPVWNKSNREHLLVGSDPASTRQAADEAVAALGWTAPYFVDADHINLETFGRFAAPCDFFTIDVADSIGKPSAEDDLRAFVEKHPELSAPITVPGIREPLQSSTTLLHATASHFLGAVQQAARIYREIASAKGVGRFVTEISMDETARPQTPAELLVILAAVADENIPIQTIAPKFTGRFNKGVDYVGDVAQFAREFREDLAVVAFAVERYCLPSSLKLSVHSGSDKYAIYPAIYSALQDTGSGVHVKTAGTTWLEELIGLAESGGDGLTLALDLYAEAYAHADELCAPYMAVIDLRHDRLPSPVTVRTWGKESFVRALRHEGNDPLYNPDLRQLLHVGYKLAAALGTRYTDALRAHEQSIAANVSRNLLERHIRPLFLGAAQP